MRILFLIVANLLGLCVIVAQDIVFNKTVYDLGTVSEDEDPVTATYIFTNKTKAPLAVATVRTTCGCTTANYSKAPILPGKQGSINIVYNPAGRPGVFNRSVTVFFSGKENPFVLQVKGYVRPGKPRKYAGYAYVLGKLQLRTTLVRFHPMKLGTQMQKSNVMVINSSNHSLQVGFKTEDPDFSAVMIPAKLAPGEKGEIVITRRSTEKQKQAEQRCVRLFELSSRENLLELLVKNELCQ